MESTAEVPEGLFEHETRSTRCHSTGHRPIIPNIKKCNRPKRTQLSLSKSVAQSVSPDVQRTLQVLDLSLSLGAHNLRNSADTRTCLWTKLLIEKQICLQTGIDRPRVIALFGPTNAGKSTIVNLLLGQPLAPMSATARHTQHPTLFAANVHALASNELVHLSSGHSIITEVPTSLSDERFRGESTNEPCGLLMSHQHIQSSLTQ